MILITQNMKVENCCKEIKHGIKIIHLFPALFNILKEFHLI